LAQSAPDKRIMIDRAHLHSHDSLTAGQSDNPISDFIIYIRLKNIFAAPRKIGIVRRCGRRRVRPQRGAGRIESTPLCHNVREHETG
jgi:hypothetical protein